MFRLTGAQFVVYGTGDYQDVAYSPDGMTYVVPDHLADPNFPCCEGCMTKSAFDIAARASATLCHGDDILVASAVSTAKDMYTPKRWFSSNAWCRTYPVTEDDASEITSNVNHLAHLRNSHFFDDDACPCDFVDFPEYTQCSLQQFLFNTDYPDTSYHSVVPTMIRLIQNIRTGDIVVRSTIRHVPDWDFVNAMNYEKFLYLQRTMNHDDFCHHIFGDDDDKECVVNNVSIVLVFRPLFGWARVRHVVRMRAIVIYWLFLTETLMAPGGAAQKRDRCAFESDFETTTGGELGA